MHDYIPAIGFSNIKKRQDIKKIIDLVMDSPDKKETVETEDGDVFFIISKEFAENIGVSVVGWLSDDVFVYEYCYPYLKTEVLSTKEDITVEKIKNIKAYCGIVEEIKMGISIIFNLNNFADYLRIENTDIQDLDTYVSLSAISMEGSILMPLEKSEVSKIKSQKIMEKRFDLLREAKRGNEEALEDITLKDMDMYNNLYKKIKKFDLYTLVDTYIMPYGIECDLYSIMAEIAKVTEVKNYITEETIYKLELLCNDIQITLCISEKNLFGEPLAGRRFKGVVWMQGYINVVNK